MTYAKILFCSLVCGAVFLTVGCGIQKKVSEQMNSISEDINEIDNNSHRSPEEAEIQSVLENNGNSIFWDVEEMSLLADNTLIYNVKAVDGKAVWNVLFSDEELISERYHGEDSEIWEFTVRENGIDCTGRLYEGGNIEVLGLTEKMSTLYAEKLMAELSDFTGMDCCLDENESNDQAAEYMFSIGEKVVYSDGYSIGENVYPGPTVLVDDEYISFYIPFVLEGKEDKLDVADLLSAEQVETLCRADLTAQMDLPEVVVFDYVEQVYYYQVQQQQLRPAWHIIGSSYCLDDNGTLHSVITARLIDAQTGEIYWVAD